LDWAALMVELETALLRVIQVVRELRERSAG
jgi:hypothetical protein